MSGGLFAFMAPMAVWFYHTQNTYLPHILISGVLGIAVLCFRQQTIKTSCQDENNMNPTELLVLIEMRFAPMLLLILPILMLVTLYTVQPETYTMLGFIEHCFALIELCCFAFLLSILPVFSSIELNIDHHNMMKSDNANNADLEAGHSSQPRVHITPAAAPAARAAVVPVQSAAGEHY